jgi:hypothetical protein
MKKIKEFIQDRLVSPINDFWKKVRDFALSVGVSAAAVLILNQQAWICVPEQIVSIMTTICWISAFVAGTAQLTKR